MRKREQVSAVPRCSTTKRHLCRPVYRPVRPVGAVWMVLWDAACKFSPGKQRPLPDLQAVSDWKCSRGVQMLLHNHPSYPFIVPKYSKECLPIYRVLQNVQSKYTFITESQHHVLSLIFTQVWLWWLELHMIVHLQLRDLIQNCGAISVDGIKFHKHRQGILVIFECFQSHACKKTNEMSVWHNDLHLRSYNCRTHGWKTIWHTGVVWGTKICRI